MKGSIAQLRKKLSGILFLLNERQRRLLIASEALALGYGGIKTLSEITGISCPTIRRGIKELKANNKKFKGIRVNGGGRKKATDNDPDLEKILQGKLQLSRCSCGRYFSEVAAVRRSGWVTEIRVVKSIEGFHTNFKRIPLVQFEIATHSDVELMARRAVNRPPGNVSERPYRYRTVSLVNDVTGEVGRRARQIRRGCPHCRI